MSISEGEVRKKRYSEEERQKVESRKMKDRDTVGDEERQPLRCTEEETEWDHKTLSSNNHRARESSSEHTLYWL